MSEDRVTYSELKFLHSKTQKKDKKRPAPKRKAFPWHSVAVILGIICFFLLMAIAILGYMCFQNCSGDKMSSVEDFQAKNTSSPVIEGHSALSPGGEHTCKSCHGKWSCCGEKCYYFSQEEKTWHDSKKACEGMGASLVKIDSKEEQEHIQSQVGYISWVGLHKKGDMYPWTWLDGSRPSQKLTFGTMNQAKANCGSLRPTNIQNAICDKSFNYICEKSFTCLAI